MFADCSQLAGIAAYGNAGIRCWMLDADCSQLAGFAADGTALLGLLLMGLQTKWMAHCVIC